MEPPESNHYTVRYAAFGAVFGLMFPVFSTLLQAFLEHGSVGIDAMMATQKGSPLLWVINSAPLFLGLFAAMAGKRQDALVGAMSELENANQKLEQSNLEMEKANAELVQASKLKSQFLANMSHELRTPLNAIIGFSRIVIRKTKDVIPERQVKNLQMVHESGQHLLEMVNDLLDIERIESGMLNVTISEVDVVEIATDVVAKLRPAAAAKELDLVVVAHEPIRVSSDSVRLRQILDNLVNNAIKYSDDGRIELRVSLAPNEDAPEEIRFEVIDQGKGIPEDHVESIFDPFHQVDGSSTRAEGGVGLGLNLVQRLAKLLGGGVRVESELGVGSTFTFFMPAEKLAGATSDAPEPMGEGPLLLVIDDEPSALELMQAQLVEHGFRVHAAASGEQGLEKAATLHPDAILLDMIMPDLDGWSVLKRLRASPTLASIPVIVTSNLHEEKRAWDLGVVAWLTKPVSPDRFAELFTNLGIGPQDDILVVEDDAPTRSLVLQGLSGMGLTIRTAPDGPSAVSAIDDRLPCAVVLDLMLPHVDGFGVLAHLRERPEGDKVPVVIYTAKDLTEEERAKLTGGAVDIIGKGGVTSLTEMVDCIRKAVARGEKRKVSATS